VSFIDVPVRCGFSRRSAENLPAGQADAKRYVGVVDLGNCLGSA